MLVEPKLGIFSPSVALSVVGEATTSIIRHVRKALSAIALRAAEEVGVSGTAMSMR